MRRVAITGIGVIAGPGRTTCEFWKSLLEGRSAIGPLETVDCSALRFQNGAEVRGYSHQPYFEDRRADFMDRFAQFAVIAAREAVTDAGPSRAHGRPFRKPALWSKRSHHPSAERLLENRASLFWLRRQ